MQPDRATLDARDICHATYTAFRIGARLRSNDIARLLAPLNLSQNQLKNLGRPSDRGLSITAEQLGFLVQAWADEQRREERNLLVDDDKPGSAQHFNRGE